jgi:hypothetical protein
MRVHKLFVFQVKVEVDVVGGREIGHRILESNEQERTVEPTRGCRV